MLIAEYCSRQNFTRAYYAILKSLSSITALDERGPPIPFHSTTSGITGRIVADLEGLIHIDKIKIQVKLHPHSTTYPKAIQWAQMTTIQTLIALQTQTCTFLLYIQYLSRTTCLLHFSKIFFSPASLKNSRSRSPQTYQSLATELQFDSRIFGLFKICPIRR